MRPGVLAQAGNSKIEALRKMAATQAPTCNRVLQCLSIITDWLKEFMNVGRRTAIKAGLALGASLWVGSREIFAQSSPLIRKKIPSSGESIPIIGIGTARRYEEITNEADKV